jgi:hypothetical protein
MIDHFVEIDFIDLLAMTASLMTSHRGWVIPSRKSRPSLILALFLQNEHVLHVPFDES